MKELTSAAAAKSLQWCRTLCDPIDGRSPGSSVPGILQVGTLEWVAISFSRHLVKPTYVLSTIDTYLISSGKHCHS